MPARVKAFKCRRTGTLFATQAEATVSENKLDRKLLAQLKKRIKAKKYWVPKVGEYIYVPTSGYIDHGEDDVVGGLGLVIDVHEGMSGGDPKCIFINVAQIPGGFNWKQFHYKEQAQYAIEFGKEFAYPDPDYGTSPEPWGF